MRQPDRRAGRPAVLVVPRVRSVSCLDAGAWALGPAGGVDRLVYRATDPSVANLLRMLDPC